MKRESLKKLGMLLGVILITLPQSSCVTATPVDNSFCVVYERVYYSEKADEIDKIQNDRNNLAWECLCSGNVDVCSEAFKPR